MNLLFVCSGNICRSPMAERLAVAVGDQLGIPVRARSAGTLGLVDRPADPKAVAVCREVGVDLRGHRSQPLSADLIRWADWVLVMEVAHASHVRAFFPDVGERLILLASFAGKPEFADPIGGWTFAFRRTRNDLDRAIRTFLPRAAR